MPLAPYSKNISILLYAVNGTGLGHVTRLMAIGRWLRRLINGLNFGARPFFLSCSDADFLLAQQGFASFKIPSRASLRSAHLGDAESLGLIRRHAARVLEEIGPDVLIVDTFPTGTFDELLPVLGRDDLLKVFVFREQRRDYMSHIPYGRLLSSYDLIVVPHEEGSCELPPELDPRLEIAWCGPIVFGEPNELWTKKKVRETLGIPRNRTVIYIAAGGGGDRDFLGTLELISSVAAEIPKSHLVIGAGPLNRDSPPTGPNQSWTSYYPISRLFRGFDFAISSSGYNTVHELLYFQLPAILYAQERGADDQVARARAVAASGAAIALERLDRESLQGALPQILDPERRTAMKSSAARLVRESGARHAAQTILDLAIPRITDRGRLPAHPAISRT